jgi:hypothetical protein
MSAMSRLSPTAGDLIRLHPSGAEVPAPGWWSIAKSHVSVAFDVRRGLFRRVHTVAPWAYGGLAVAEDVAELALVLHVGVSPSSDSRTRPSLTRLLDADHLSEVTLRVPGFAPTAATPWRADGTVEAGTQTQRAPVSLIYHGVYRRASAATAWLSVTTEIARDAAGKPLQRPVRVAAEVLAVKSRFPATQLPQLIAA